ncbi:MAG: hypothetical protein IJT87_02285 [Ruminiclostridium sp.]|nr:hypothetical protein [Ruminiclostridium sp.]
MKIKGKYSESAVLYAIILSVAAVLAVAVFFVVYNVLNVQEKEKPAAETTAPVTSVAETTEKAKEQEVDPEVAAEMQDAAVNLIKDNYTVLRLYYTKGMNHKDEPYGNTPEDGYYSVDSDKYSSLDQLEAIVDRTYTEEFAQTVKTDPLGYGAIYKTRDNGDLGIIAGFTPMEYTRSWDTPKFEISPISDTECDLTVKIHEKADNALVETTARMTKTADGWRLTSMIF